MEAAAPQGAAAQRSPSQMALERGKPIDLPEGREEPWHGGSRHWPAGSRKSRDLAADLSEPRQGRRDSRSRRRRRRATNARGGTRTGHDRTPERSRNARARCGPPLGTRGRERRTAKRPERSGGGSEATLRRVERSAWHNGRTAAQLAPAFPARPEGREARRGPLWGPRFCSVEIICLGSSEGRETPMGGERAQSVEGRERAVRGAAWSAARTRLRPREGAKARA